MHRILIQTLSVACLWALLPGGTAGGQTPLRMADCIQYAYDHHPNMRLAQLQIADADWQIKENKAIGYPQLSASIGYQYFLQRPGIPASALGFPGAGDEKVAFNAYHSLTPAISWNQLLFSNSYLIGLKAARYYRDLVQGQVAVTRQNLRNGVIDTYLPALLISENLRILEKNIGNLEKLLAETKATTQAGFAEQLDVDRLELALSNLRTERENIARQQEVVVNALKFSMGMPVKDTLTLSDDLAKLLGEYAGADLSTELNFNNRPEYVQLLKGRDLNAIQVDLASKPWMPTVAAFLQYQPGFQGGFGNDTKWYFIPAAVVGVSLNIPIWDGGAAKAKRERAIIGVQTVDAQKQILENALTLDIENARKQYRNADERVKSQQKNLDLAQRIYNTTQTKYKAGVGSSFELVSAEQQLYSAQQSMMQAQYDLLAARVAIKKALGGE